eukprot:CAMPEP_0169131472 /NCGR_PEP_ID=MMETSP1015-20121227/38266_1 /TAXON_ID=342587 /ORGANISM="Karlodinium micrum, Strain CCMP2283" /LENGTH=170 /DNA_ID=CAMNT_0009195737 /DNA_START=75 /DNA_END=587 /DNA_ORIENTATION=-
MALLFTLSAVAAYVGSVGASKEADRLMRKDAVVVGEVSSSGSLTKVATQLHAFEGTDNPCSYLGCNSHKCEWASGGRITRVVAGKACSNAFTVGIGAGEAALTANATEHMHTIVTLKDCLRAVTNQEEGKCGDHFQLHKDTMACSCVPVGSKCSQQEDQNVCRYQVLDAV